MGLGIYHLWKHLFYDKKFSKIKQECDNKIEDEMQQFCEKTAAKYGICRHTDISALYNSILDTSYYLEKVPMKNEDAVDFLEEERQDILNRKDAMFDRISKLPVEGKFSSDRSSIEIGRNCGLLSKGGYNELLTKAKKYIENGGEAPTEEYLQYIYNVLPRILDNIDRDIAILQKGIHGEELVRQQLKLYEGKYKVLENIVIDSVDSQGNTSEVDTYIITDKGLVVAEIKNYGNENQRLHITNDGRWIIEDAHYGRILKRIDKSPIEQNARHCLAVERLLKEEFGEECDIPIIPVVFIANNKVSIQNESRSAVIRVSEFYTFINSISGGMTVPKKVQEEIERVLKDKDIGARDFSVDSRRQMMDGLEQVEKVFTQYVLYNHEVAKEYPEVVKKHVPYLSMTPIVILLAIPYLLILILLKEWTTRFKIFLCITYSAMIINVPIGILVGIIVFFILFL